MNDPHIWWYVTRASAIIAWALMTLSVVWGILLSTRVMRRVDNPAWLQDLHSFLGGTMLIMVGLHMVSLIFDQWLTFSPAEVLVPFATDFKPLPVALGILSFYLLVAIQGSSLIMNRLPRRFWKGVHYSSFVAVILISFHAGFTGTDVGTIWYRIVAIALIVLTAVAVVIRVITGTATRPARRIDAARAAPGGASPVPQPERRTLVVASAAPVADGVLGIRLEGRDPPVLPLWHPGAHLTLHLPNGLERQYSLCGDPADRHHYDIAVLRTTDSEGGSEWIHDHVVPGTSLEVSGPLNHFELEPAAGYLFIAGGIGITPMKAMLESLPPQRSWRLIYTGRKPTHDGVRRRTRSPVPRPRAHPRARRDTDPARPRPGHRLGGRGGLLLRTRIADERRRRTCARRAVAPRAFRAPRACGACGSARARGMPQEPQELRGSGGNHDPRGA